MAIQELVLANQELPPAPSAPPAPYSTAVSEVSEPPQPYTSAAAGSTTSSCAWTENSLVFCDSQPFHAAEKSPSLDHDVVDHSVSAPALRRFHKKCDAPWRTATASCPHRRLSGRQNHCQWPLFKLMKGRKDERKSYFCYEIFSCTQMSKRTMSSISLNWKNES